MSIINKINWAMSLREPQFEALRTLNKICAKLDFKTCNKSDVERVAKENSETQDFQKVDKSLEFPSFCFEMATGERVIIVMGAVNVMKPRVSGTLNKYILCIA